MRATIKLKKRMEFGEKVADNIASVVGSWNFVIFQSVFIIMWLTFNVILNNSWWLSTQTGITAWDPYPFILLNLALSFQAAYSMPIIMMSQNRSERRDRFRAEADYKVNVLAEKEISEVIDSLKNNSEKIETSLSTHQRIEAIEIRLHDIHSLLEQSIAHNKIDKES